MDSGYISSLSPALTSRFIIKTYLFHKSVSEQLALTQSFVFKPACIFSSVEIPAHSKPENGEVRSRYVRLAKRILW